MSSFGLSSVFSESSFLAGIAEQKMVLLISIAKSTVDGSWFPWSFTQLAFVLFVSPIPTFRRSIRNQTTEQFSGLPYIYSLLNCLIFLWYDMPFVSPSVILVATVNSFGAVFQLIYITIFIVYANKSDKLKMSALVFIVFAFFGLLAFTSMRFSDPDLRKLVVGYLSVASLISMFASPLVVINLVIKTRSVEFMPFYLSLATFLMSISFFAYGMLQFDPFIYIPNGIGALLGLLQLALYYYYNSKYGEGEREPLIAPYV